MLDKYKEARLFAINALQIEACRVEKAIKAAREELLKDPYAPSSSRKMAKVKRSTLDFNDVAVKIRQGKYEELA